jgi:tetratricopeptide (TPR) repeat protein
MARSASVWMVLLVVLSVSGPVAQSGNPAEQLGTVNFQTSCAREVVPPFNRAVALLHSFEFRSAMAGFNAVLAKDSSCAIAYWGIALSYWGNPFAGVKSGPLLENGRAAIEKGLSTGTPTSREQGFLRAVSALYTGTDPATHRQRTVAYATAMDRVQRDNPGDIEARIFYALAVNQTADPADKAFTAQFKAAGILEPLWKQYPQHPGLPHYIIHAYDHPPLAARAMDAARRYATVAPAAAHALHMPSHTFTRVGMWKESVETNIASERTALADGAVAEALHAMDYQIYAYLQLGDDGNARAVRDRVPATVAKLDLTGVGGAAPAVAGIYGSSAIPARYALERGAWSEAAALAPRATTFPHADAVTHFARALGSARSGKAAAVTNDIEQLGVLRDKLAAMHDDYWRSQVDIQMRVAQAWLALANGRRGEALELMRAAADAEDATDKAAISPGPLAPARELLGEMLLETGDARQALAAFEATMAKEPNRFRGIAGAAMAAEKAGDKARAQQHYRKLLSVASGAGADRPELQHARAFIAGTTNRP